MEFRLIYKGPLPAQGGKGDSRVSEKHSIRRQIHPQLKELWHTQIGLRHYTWENDMTKPLYAPTAPGEKIRLVDRLAHQAYSKFGYQFMPLVSEHFGLTCALDILFLRRDAPGRLIQGGGDIDNRIKVLLDGLTMPKSKDECPKPPEGW